MIVNNVRHPSLSDWLCLFLHLHVTYAITRQFKKKNEKKEILQTNRLCSS